MLRPLMDRVGAMRDQLVFELTQGAQARLDLARERHGPLLADVERRRPSDVSGGQWQTAMDGLWVFLAAGYGAEAERLGWPRDELYAVPPLWSRVELCGAGLLVGDREVTEVTPDAIVIRTASGAVQRIYRRPKVDYRVAYEAHLKSTRGNYKPDSEEAHLRALERTVFLFRNDNPDANLEEAKAAVLAAIGRSSTEETTAR